jgi:hypothetical protein
MKRCAPSAIAVIFALAGPAAAVPDNFTEEAWQIKAPSYGCKSNDDYSRLMDFILSGDDLAGLKFVTPRMLSGACTIMQPGKVFLEQASLFGNPCVRKRGETDCFYTRRINLEQVK